MKIEERDKAGISNSVEMREKLEAVEKQTRASLISHGKDLDFMKACTAKTDKDLRQLEWYLNKVQPMEHFSSLCNMMHSVISDKQSLNNLIEYEQSHLHQLITQNNIKEKDN